MFVVNLSYNDYSNFSFDNSMSLKAVGIDCKSYTLSPHPFNYKYTSEVKRGEEIKTILLQADIVQIFHSCSRSLNLYISSKSKAKLIVYHAGSTYRRDPEKYNHLFNGFVDKSIMALPEFAGLGAKNEHYIVGAIDTDKFTIRKPVTKPYVFAHYPSSVSKKGTMDIIRMFKETNTELTYSDKLVDAADQYKRMMQCDVYVELFKPILEGKPYGSFGITTLEAAAMGKVVLTQCLQEEVYTNEYGFLRALNAIDEATFKDFILLLRQISEKELTQLQEETRQWVVDKHSYKPTGERIWKVIGNA